MIYAILLLMLVPDRPAPDIAPPARLFVPIGACKDFKGYPSCEVKWNAQAMYTPSTMGLPGRKQYKVNAATRMYQAPSGERFFEFGGRSYVCFRVAEPLPDALFQFDGVQFEIHRIGETLILVECPL